MEKRWITKAGLKACVYIVEFQPGIRHHRCGYVCVGASVLKQMHYDNKKLKDISVHGGLTFAGYLPDEDGWWLGYDCAHYMDGEIDRSPRFSSFISDGCEPRSLEFCMEQCEQLAEQIGAINKAHKAFWPVRRLIVLQNWMNNKIRAFRKVLYMRKVSRKYKKEQTSET